MEWRPAFRSKSMSCTAYRTSKPAIQNRTAKQIDRTLASASPVTAIQAASGAAPRHAPRTRWEAQVNRFMYE